MIDTITKDINVLRLYGDKTSQSIIDTTTDTSYIKVQDIQNKGRGYVATQDIPKGTLIHVSDPLSTVVNQEWMPETCTQCFHFHYPKKLKIKAIQHDQELKDLLLWWEEQQQIEKDDLKKRRREEVYTKDEIIQNEEEEFHLHHDQNENNDDLLKNYLDQAWSLLPPTLSSTSTTHHQEKEENNNDYRLDNNDLTICKLIISCILKYHSEQQQLENQHDQHDHYEHKHVSFNELWNIQDNEITYFKHHYQQQQQEKEKGGNQKGLKKKPTKWEELPLFLQQHIQLYHYFESSIYIPIELFQYSIPHLSSSSSHLLDKKKFKELFRSIYYREMANSFGLWEQSSSNDIFKKEDNHPSLELSTTVTDDLELLGFGIYPSAVYFNHSCDANILKLRHGDQMYFYSKKQILKNDELCISYGNVETPFLERRQRLFDHYHFLCQCQKCILEQETKIDA
ncbi:unnamed protein product [Cunninghamella blakesleeana]